MRLGAKLGALSASGLLATSACSVLTDLSQLGASADASTDVNAGTDASALGCGAADAGLLAYWPMEEGQGTAVADCSGNGFDATLIGNGTWVTGRRPGIKAIQFDTTVNTYVLVPPSALADAATTFTLAAWVNLGSGVNSYVIHKGQPPTMSWSLEMESDTSLSFYISPDGTNATDANRANGPVSAWFHIAAVYRPGLVQTLYVNGVSVVSAAPPVTMNQTNEQLMIGWHTLGMIDEVRVYSRALSAAEISALAAE